MTIAESLREVMECSVLPRQALPVFAKEKFVISMTNREALHAFGVPVCHDAKFRGARLVKTGMLKASRQGGRREEGRLFITTNRGEWAEGGAGRRGRRCQAGTRD